MVRKLRGNPLTSFTLKSLKFGLKFILMFLSSMTLSQFLAITRALSAKMKLNQSLKLAKVNTNNFYAWRLLKLYNFNSQNKGLSLIMRFQCYKLG